MVDGVGTTAFTYDAASRPITVTDSFSSTVGYRYDATGNRASLRYADGKLFRYAYDPSNRLMGLTDGTSQVGYAYDPAGRVTHIQHIHTNALSLDGQHRLSPLATSQGFDSNVKSQTDAYLAANPSYLCLRKSSGSTILKPDCLLTSGSFTRCFRSRLTR